MGQVVPCAISADEIRTQVASILGAPSFEASARIREFLTYVVEETLAGRAAYIKAYTVATTVFGRPTDFDPQIDSIVRIEAGRLRRALVHYYLTDGTRDPIRIEIPKGSYVPEFTHRDAARAREIPVFGRPGIPRVFVAAFDERVPGERHRNIGGQLTRQIAAGLARFPALHIYGAKDEHDPGISAPDADYILSGSVILCHSRIALDVLLQSTADHRYVWSWQVECGLQSDSVMSLRDEIADSVVRSIAEPYGVLFSEVREGAGSAPGRFPYYSALLDFYQYSRDFDPDRFEPARRHLEAAVREHPDLSEAFACLSMLYTHAARFGYELEEPPPDLLRRAGRLADEACTLSPCSCRAFQARGLAEWYSGDPDAGIGALRAAHRLNPNDTSITAELGLRLAERALWDEAVPLIESSYRRNPCHPGSFRIGLFLYHFTKGRFERALHEISRVDAPGVPCAHLATAAALAGLNRMTEARATLGTLQGIKSGYTAVWREDPEFRLLDPSLVDALANAIARIPPDRPVAPARHLP